MGSPILKIFKGKRHICKGVKTSRAAKIKNVFVVYRLTFLELHVYHTPTAL
jgi:hypothetical protein